MNLTIDIILTGSAKNNLVTVSRDGAELLTLECLSDQEISGMTVKDLLDLIHENKD